MQVESIVLLAAAGDAYVGFHLNTWADDKWDTKQESRTCFWYVLVFRLTDDNQ